MKILIVDDEPQVAEVLARSLRREGHQATIATSGEQALSLVGPHDPDALFLDVSMPGMNGLDVLAEVRRRRPSLPVVVITGHATPDEVEQVKKMGAVDVIEKPAPLTHYQLALKRLNIALLVVALLCIGVSASAQLLRPPTDPQGLEQPRKAPMTLTPSITVSEEFNDNVFLDNRNKQWDFITRFTPGISFEVGEPTYRLAAGYFFTADLYARHPELDHFFDAHSFIADALWRATPHLTLSAFETFTLTTNTNLVNQESVSTGFNRSYSNYIGGGAAYQLDRLTAVRGGALWNLQRYEDPALFDSDTYGVDVALDRVLTPRLTGTVAYQYRFFDFHGRLPNTTTHTPALGVSYRFTDTITGKVSAGPTFESDGTSRITPAVTASLSQRYGWGNIGVDYSRAVGTAGGLGGTADNQSGGITAQLTSLMPRLVVQGGPRFTSSVSPDHRIDIHGVTLPVQATYRLRTGIALIAAYQFFYQRSDSLAVTPAGTVLAPNADQNRLWVGIQFGYPIKFE